MYRNPFYLGWNKGWSFLFFLEGGIAKIEAKGFGISITTKVEKGESPLESADRLVSKEQRIRKSRYYSWVKSINEKTCLLYTSPRPRDGLLSRMPSSA